MRGILPSSASRMRDLGSLTLEDMISNNISLLQFRNKFLPKDIKIVGYARTKMDHSEYLRRVRSYIKVPTREIEEQLNAFCNICTYYAGQYDKDESFQGLEKHLAEVEKGQKRQNRVFYMALPPTVFITVSQHLRRNNYPKNGVARVFVRFWSLFFFNPTRNEGHGAGC